jgi:hypothetical protein
VQQLQARNEICLKVHVCHKIKNFNRVFLNYLKVCVNGSNNKYEITMKDRNALRNTELVVTVRSALRWQHYCSYKLKVTWTFAAISETITKPLKNQNFSQNMKDAASVEKPGCSYFE